MRTWLFYKATEVAEGIQVEFKRLAQGGLSKSLTKPLCQITLLEKDADVDEAVKSLVRQSGWVAGAAQSADSPVGKAMLRGKW